MLYDLDIFQNKSEFFEPLDHGPLQECNFTINVVDHVDGRVWSSQASMLSLRISLVMW